MTEIGEKTLEAAANAVHSERMGPDRPNETNIRYATRLARAALAAALPHLTAAPGCEKHNQTTTRERVIAWRERNGGHNGRLAGQMTEKDFRKLETIIGKIEALQAATVDQNARARLHEAKGILINLTRESR